MLNKDLRAWLATIAPDVVFSAGPDQNPNLTDRYCLVTPAGGGPMEVEFAIDVPAFQLRCFGDQSDGDNAVALDSAEELAWDLDRKILTAFRPVIGGRVVNSFQRYGSPPSPLGTMDNADRVSVVCTYLAKIESGY